MADGSLAEAFVDAAGQDPDADEAATLATTLTALARDGRASLGALEVSDEAFAAYLGGHEQGRALVRHASLGKAVDPTVVAELWLACGLAKEAPAALRAFEERYLSDLAAKLKLALDAAQLDEIRQRTREKLLLRGGDGTLKVEGYAGQGRLSGLVRVVATREAVALFRQTRREVSLDWATMSTAADADAPVKEAYRSAFQQAFLEALGELSSRDRNLLRLHGLGGVTLDALAKMYGVHRATVVRWLAAAREAALDGTRRRLAERLEARPDEVDSVLAWVTSRLDVSLGAALETLQRSQATNG